MTDNSNLSMKYRWVSLAYAFGVFAILYSLTNIYAQTLFYDIQFSGLNNINSVWSKKVYNLVTPIDSALPFIPLMIVPYSWSILLFCASFFMVKTPEQLSLLTKRLILATLFACLIFYVFPAKFSFERPTVLGWAYYGYQFLHITDKPFNQLPSLHVTYAVLLGMSLWQISKSALYRLALCCICNLIIVSTVLTYQHHLLDIAGGLLLAVLVSMMAHNLRNNLVLKYLAVAISGFLILSIVGFMVNRSLGSIVFKSLYSLVAIYWMLSFFGLAWMYQYPNQPRDKRWFTKNKQGQLSLSTWLRFMPLLLSYRLMWYVGQRYRSNQSQPLDINALRHTDMVSTYKVTDSIYAIATPKLLSFSQILNEHYSYFTTIIVVDMAVETNSHHASLKKALAKQAQTLDINNNNSSLCSPHSLFAVIHIEYLYFPMLDLQSLKEIDAQTFIELFKEIDTVVAVNKPSYITIKQPPSSMTLINFQCVMGLSRSIAIHALYLVYHGKLTFNNYVTWINEQYPKAHINDYYLPKRLVNEVEALAKNE